MAHHGFLGSLAVEGRLVVDYDGFGRHVVYLLWMFSLG
jgi:hypothetical protein